jgi:tripartite ATP-independent transporter DctM subunit
MAMSAEAIGVIGLVVLLATLFAGVPIGVALGLVGLAGLSILISPEAALIKSGVVAFDLISKYELGVLPLFMFMAHLTFAAGASRDFFDAAAKFLGHRKGGLALASVGACAGFGAISGSSLATAATVGLVALPEMRARGYAPSLATGALAAGGTLGSMVPPSAALIVFGVIAEQSIGKLFAAALLPAATQILFYMAAITLLCALNPRLAPAYPPAPWRERFAALARIGDLLALIVVVIGGMAIGLFTPSEAAAIGAVSAFLLCAFRRALNWANLKRALEETLRTTGMIYLVIIGAMIFAAFIGVSGLTALASGAVQALHASPIAAIAAMAVALLLLGSFLDGMALMLLTTPIFLPIATDLGMSPIWFGIFLVRAMEIGFVHPPVGMNVYVIHGLAKDIPLTTVFKGIVPFLLADFLHLALLIAVPSLALALPNWLGS